MNNDLQIQLLYAQLQSLAKQRELSQIERLNLRVLHSDNGILIRLKELSGSAEKPIRIAVLSLLFNWPSTGGGIVHTAELATFLTEAGFDICHLYAVYSPWQVGQVAEQLPYNSRPILFDENSWNIAHVAARFRQAVDALSPDLVIITDSWNSKPQLAHAMSNYPYFLRLAALECICPLNNVRLLIDEQGQPEQCQLSQLSTPESCRTCIENNLRSSGQLHIEERRFSEFHSEGYAELLQSAFRNATGVFAVNPLIANLCEPYSKAVHVIPSGFDPRRFQDLPTYSHVRPFRLLFAGLVQEYMKGFHILFQACIQLWSKRHDFELHVTAESTPNYSAPFLRYRGWQDQTSLPNLMADCHAVIVPTIAQEALGRTAVEAMGAGRAVVASRIGGLPFTITDELTGLLVEPSNAIDLAAKIERLLDEPDLAATLGRSGKSKFHSEFTWDVIIDRHYRPVLGGKREVFP